ncbi:hypothetical protein ACJ4V0_18740 [Phreatobacter sp. HK31-P]
MDPRRIAIIAGIVSTVVLGVAVAQIMPGEPRRRTEAPTAATPLRTAIRDVTPLAVETPAPSTTRTIQTSQAQPPPAPPPATERPVPARRATPPVSVELLPDNEELRERVGSMRERLILAARSGDIARLGIAFQVNETMPVFTRGGERDPVAFWKKASGDGEGREILAILLNILELPAALINKGTPQEMYVWPYLAHVPLNDLSPRQSVDLYRLMTAQDVRDMRTLGSWVFWRLGIGPDGTVHFFLAGE